MTKKMYAVLESEYVNCDTKYEFEVEVDATPEEIREYGGEVIRDNICWHVEDEDGNEI